MVKSKYCNVSIWNGRNANATSKFWIPGISIQVGVLNIILSSLCKVKETVQMKVMFVRLSVCDLVLVPKILTGFNTIKVPGMCTSKKLKSEITFSADE